MNPKNEIVAIARGYYAMPIINALSRRGVLQQLLAGGVRLAELDGNHRNLEIVMRYLQNVGWITIEGDRYRPTALGSKVLRRYGAFAILYSYRPYMRNLEQLLFEPAMQVQVHRDDNVVGSGQAHVRKYFSRLGQQVRATEAKYLLDVGCGDGTFLNYCKALNPELQLIGVDYSERALAVTRSKLTHDALLLNGNVSEPRLILERLRSRGIPPEQVMVSVWFIFHEVLGFPGIDLSEVLRGYRELAPRHGMIVGEIFDIPAAVLAEHHNDTAIPEFNLFHDLSGQKLFSLPAWREHIAAAGMAEQLFIGLDALEHEGQTYYGSAIWQLQPA